LRGTSLEEGAMVEFGRLVSAACRPISDKRGTIEYRVQVAAVLAQRAVRIAYQRAKSQVNPAGVTQ
jgi:xanthine dehydrogenase FAD-binding subunit